MLPVCPVCQSVMLVIIVFGPVVQNYKSKYTCTLLFFVDKMGESFPLQRILIFYQQQKNSVFKIFMFQFLTNRLYNNIVNFWLILEHAV